MDKSTDWIIIGRFGRAHGIKGLISVHSFSEPRDNILRYSDWHAFINKEWQLLKLLRVEVNNKSILAQIEGYNEREQVAQLTNIEIAVSREQLPQLAAGEFYWHELVGMQVINQDGLSFGKVIEVLPTGANDVLVVEGDRRRLIPYLPGKYVLEIDASQRLINVDWDADF